MGFIIRVFLFLVILCTLGFGFNQFVPAQHLFWRNLNPEAPIGIATRTQLFRLSLSPSKSCMTMARDIASLSSVPARPKSETHKCGWTVARYVSAAGNISLFPGEATMQCPLSIGGYIWLKAVDETAQDWLGSPLTSVYHAGTYACRRQRGNNSGAWSEHAFANAWDITGFGLADGRVISVLNDWDGDTAKQRFLREVRREACKIFRVTLSPDYNAAHKDHFHLDMGPATACR